MVALRLFHTFFWQLDGRYKCFCCLERHFCRLVHGTRYELESRWFLRVLNLPLCFVKLVEPHLVSLFCRPEVPHSEQLLPTPQNLLRIQEGTHQLPQECKTTPESQADRSSVSLHRARYSALLHPSRSGSNPSSSESQIEEKILEFRIHRTISSRNSEKPSPTGKA